MENRLFNRIAFWKKADTNNVLGVYVGVKSLWVYQTTPTVKFQEFPFKSDHWAIAFADIAEAFGPAKIQLLLSSSFYQIFPADKPNVDASEIAQALLWSVKDIVNLPVNQIHLDYFESPILNNNKVTVVAADRDMLAAMVQAALGTHLQIVGIFVEELAMSNLFEPEPQARLVIHHCQQQELLLTVVKEGAVVMQRRVRGFSELDGVSAQDLSYGVADNLSLEIQRSMDYFESQLRQAPVASIDIFVDGARSELVKLVSANFNQPVREVNTKSVGAKMAELAFAEYARGLAS